MIKPENRLAKPAKTSGMTAEEMDAAMVDETVYGAFDGLCNLRELHDVAYSSTANSKVDEGFNYGKLAYPKESSDCGVQSTEDKGSDVDRVDESSKVIQCSPSPSSSLTGWVSTEAQITLSGQPTASTYSRPGNDQDSKLAYSAENEDPNTDRSVQVSEQPERFHNPPTAFTAIPPTSAAIRLFGTPAPSPDAAPGNDENTEPTPRSPLDLPFGKAFDTEHRIKAGDELETSTDSDSHENDKPTSLFPPRLRTTFPPFRRTEVQIEAEDEPDTEDTIDLDSTDMLGKSKGPIFEEDTWSTKDSMTGSTTAKQCAGGKIEELPDHSVRGSSLDTPDMFDTTLNASTTTMQQDQGLETLAKKITLICLTFGLWFLLPAFLNLYFMHLPGLLFPEIRISVANMIPEEVRFTQQGLITTLIALVPCWIIMASGVAKTLHKIFSPLGMFEYLGVLTMVLPCCNLKLLDVIFLTILDLVRHTVLGDWQMTYQISSTVILLSTPIFILMTQALGVKLTHNNKVFWKSLSGTTQGNITIARRRDPPTLSGLGTFSVLPPEIRFQIWQILFHPTAPTCRPRVYEPRLLGDTFATESREQKILSKLQENKQLNILPDHNPDSLTILRTSKQLHDEIVRELYRSRTLRFCFDNNEHGLLLQRLGGKNTDYYIQLGGFCVARDFANTDFSLFKSVHLDIELPGNECSLEKMNDLRTHIREFSELIQAWQARKYHETQRKCPQIYIAVRLHKGTQLYDFQWSKSPFWEISLQNIYHLLRHLRSIDNVEDVTIKVHFRLRYGQEWLPQVLHEIVHQMKRVGDDILKDHHRTSFMCAKAEQLTDASLGSNLGGPLSEEPPENQLADFSFAL
ncbi:hypothetical protein XANCAGTX0491_007398 [Xanthoria calcicola]